jgi:hypothetical protein
MPLNSMYVAMKKELKSLPSPVPKKNFISLQKTGKSISLLGRKGCRQSL